MGWNMSNYVNYIFTIIGLGMVIISIFLIFSDRLKGEGLYFDIYVKEQEIRKSIADAEEMIDELKYTSEAVINEIEQNINDFREYFKEIKERETKQPIYNEINIQNKDFLNEEENTKKEENLPKINNRINEIYEYYNEGMEIEEIAKKLDIGKGEVSLILSLRSGVVKNGNV